MRNKKLIGTGVAIVTPFNKNGKVDVNALTKIVKHLHEGQVDYIVVLGTTGESVTLSFEEKQLGYYLHYKAISKATKKDIILYNVPGRTGSNVTWETQVRIAKDFKNIVATKEASGNLEQIMKVIKNKPDDFMVISGDDNLTLPIIAAGGIGVISVVAQAFPKEYSQMVRFCLKGDFIKAKNIHYKIMDITDQLFLDGNPGGIKFALSLLKKCESYVRLPLSEPNKKVKDELKRLVKNYK